MLKPFSVSFVTCVIHGFRYVDELNILVSRYHSAMDSLSELHLGVLASQIKRVAQEMNFGCKRLTWSSLGTVPT